jgi:hypothetical protein
MEPQMIEKGDRVRAANHPERGIGEAQSSGPHVTVRWALGATQTVEWATELVLVSKKNVQS